MPKKLPKNVVMNNENDQKYYDALCEIEDFDINRAEDMENLVVVENGKIKTPFFAPGLVRTEPETDEKGNWKDGEKWKPPHQAMIIKNLVGYAKEGNLFYYAKGESTPRAISFETDRDGAVRAKVSEQNMENQVLQEPEKPGFWHWLGNKLFGMYREEFRQYDEKKAAYDLQTAAKGHFMEEKENKAASIASANTLKSFDQKAVTREGYNKNYDGLFGPEVKNLGNDLDRVTNSLGTDTNYHVPEGFTPKMTENLVRINLASPEIAKNNHSNLDEPDDHMIVAVTHGTEDPMFARNGLEKRLQGTLRESRLDVKKALEVYEKDKNPEPIGKIIGQNMSKFCNYYTRNMDGLSEKYVNAMRNNVAILELMETHRDIFHSATKNGLSKETLDTLQAQRNIVRIYDKSIEAQKELLMGKANGDPQLMRECTADIMMADTVGKMLKMNAVEFEKYNDEVLGPDMMNNIKNGMDPTLAANIHAMKSMSHEIKTPGADWFRSLNDSAVVSVLRDKMKTGKTFKELCDGMQKDGPAKTLNNKAKINRIIGDLTEMTFDLPEKNAPQSAPEKANVKQNDKVQTNEQSGPQVGGN